MVAAAAARPVVFTECDDGAEVEARRVLALTSTEQQPRPSVASGEWAGEHL